MGLNFEAPWRRNIKSCQDKDGNSLGKEVFPGVGILAPPHHVIQAVVMHVHKNPADKEKDRAAENLFIQTAVSREEEREQPEGKKS